MVNAVDVFTCFFNFVVIPNVNLLVKEMFCYRPQRSCGKVIFSPASVILSTKVGGGGGGGPGQTPLSRHPPWTDTPPGQTTPRQTPPGQTPPTPGRHPPGQTPPGRHPLGRHHQADTPHAPGQTPPWQALPGRPPQADTPLPSACWDTHIPAQCMQGYTPRPGPTPAATTADGTHSTGIHSCLLVFNERYLINEFSSRTIDERDNNMVPTFPD